MLDAIFNVIAVLGGLLLFWAVLKLGIDAIDRINQEDE